MKKSENEKILKEMKEEFLSDLYEYDDKISKTNSVRAAMDLLSTLITKWEDKTIMIMKIKER